MSAPEDDDIEAIARRTVEALPEPFRAGAAQVLLRVEDWPPDDFLDELGIDDPLDLTGLYDGIPVTEKSVTDPASFPDTVWLFREPILQEWRDRGDIDFADLVAHVTVHEFAHHFGWSDDDIATIDRWWE
ncbi:metallopeptidase family protein [Salipiger mucosus]|uniref:Acetylglutamate kinase n=1 Tax=Salipiger mucosus DSM 16094 TaxID=1123237 RepID=S9QMZ1_9RHOB|nr:metallopeptidase family protein [Salipiger mucosus]EPX82836.1 hypothetical protein Salmuc_05189 [Salipiger mucosus DSM 16094]